MGKTDRIQLEEDGVLICPECNQNYLHQESCEVIFRTEDKDGMVTHVDHDHAMTGRIGSEQIYGRRDVLYINFSCEYCPDIKRMMVQQHKGLTFILWVD